MKSCRLHYNSILLLILIVAGPVWSAPGQTASQVCQYDTAELYRNNFGLVKQVGDLGLWTEEMRSVASNVCTRHTPDKTTCVLDYVNTTDSSDWCLDVPDTIYVETTFIYKCENNDDDKHVFYSIKNRPACYAASCYDGYDMSVLDDIERATFDAFTNEFKAPNADVEWGDRDGFDTCTQMRLEVTDPIVSVAVAVVDTPSPTSSSAPTTSPAPTNKPTISPAPTTTSAPTVKPIVLSCKDESANLISGSNSLQVREFGEETTINPVAVGLANIHNILEIDTNTGEGFDKYCSTLQDNSENVTALCEFNYDAVNSFTADTENSVAELCHDANGVYVEDSVSITCTSVDNATAVTRLVFTNKPSCRSKLCSATGVRELATTDFDRWMKLTLEVGLEEAFIGTAPILNGAQSCVIDTEEDEDDEVEGVDVAVLGFDLSNVGREAIAPTLECQAFTDPIDGNIEIYNERSVFQTGILAYVDTDMREICGSPEPDFLECNFDWLEIFAVEEEEEPVDPEEEGEVSEAEPRQADVEKLKSMCMPDGSGSSGYGQYVESTFQFTCTNEEGKTMTVTSTNVPGCVGRPCTPGEAQSLFEGDYDFLADHFIKEGFDCSIPEVLSVHTPYYNPFFGTYDMEGIASNPQFDAEESIDEDPSGPLVIGEEDLDSPAISREVDFDEQNPDGTPGIGGGENVVVINDGSPTQPPSNGATDSNLHLRGPQFGNLFKTQPPIDHHKHPGVVLGAASSSPLRFSSGTTTLLLLIPAALSMLVL